MDKLIIEGGQKLKGEIKVSGAKNSALPLLFACLLTEAECTLENTPNLVDIKTTLKILEELGVQTKYNSTQHIAKVQAKKLTSYEAAYDLVRTMRASVLVLGPLLARFGKAKVSLPGGCSIGARPVNLHLTALEKMGARIQIENGYINATSDKLKGADITFDNVSVGATENLLMAASLAKGKTTLRNAAQEPEIVDLAQMLKKMGAKIHGEGTPLITIEGVETLGGCQHRIIPDRIEAGTYLVAAALTRGEIFLPDVPTDLLSAVIEKLKATGLEIEANSKGIKALMKGSPIATDLSTSPFPGFPTDMQAQFMVLMTVANGTSIIRENIFENRFMHVAELMRLGADIAISGNTATVRGKPNLGLSGATVMATDLRASACLVLAGLVANGKTTVRRIYHLDRGYEDMEQKLTLVGAKIRREKDT